MNTVDIDKLASLARLTVPEEEKADFIKEFEAILAYVNQIQEADTGESEAAHDLINVLREDNGADGNPPSPSGSNTEKLLSLSPDRDGDYIKVKKIL